MSQCLFCHTNFGLAPYKPYLSQETMHICAICAAQKLEIAEETIRQDRAHIMNIRPNDKSPIDQQMGKRLNELKEELKIFWGGGL